MTHDPMQGGYFLYHSIGMIPDHRPRLAAELSKFAALWSTPDDGQWPAVLGARQEFIELWARLIEAPATSITTVENVTAGLYSLIGSLPDGQLRGRRVLVGADCFPSLHFLLSGLAERFGFTLHTVPCRPGQRHVEDEDLIAAWQDDVGLALLTWVSSTTSHRCDHRRLGAHGRAMGSFTVLDLTQGIGIVPFCAAGAEVDALVSTSLKWIGGVSGAGMLHVRQPLIQTLRPELRGWFSQENPFSWDLDAFRYAGDARRFDHGTPAPLAAIATVPALRWLTDTGVAPLRAHNLRLTGRLISGADALGLRVVTPRPEERRGGSVMLDLGAGVDGAALIAALRAGGMHADIRGTVLRLSPGIVTTDAGVERLLAALPPMLKKAAA